MNVDPVGSAEPLALYSPLLPSNVIDVIGMLAQSCRLRIIASADRGTAVGVVGAVVAGTDSAGAGCCLDGGAFCAANTCCTDGAGLGVAASGVVAFFAPVLT
jgi:hypothetical protein